MRTQHGRTFFRAALLSTLLLGLTGTDAASPASAASPFQQGSELVLVNGGEQFIDRHGDGGFTARPILSAQPQMLGYGVKDPVDGAWLTALYLVQDEARSVNGGWEYTIDYPSRPEQPELDSDRSYLLALYARHNGEIHEFDATIPFHEPTGLWDRVINAFNPARWARSLAGWVVEGVHALLCSVLGKITGADLDDC